MSRIAIDLDGVLANFPQAYRSLCRQMLGIDIPEVPTCWDWDLPSIGREGRRVVWGYITEHPEWQATLPVYDETETVLRRLDRVGSRHELYFITHRPGACKWHTEEWLRMWGMERPTVIVCRRKWEVFGPLGIELGIEDNVENATRCKEAGAGMTLVTRPWNREWTGPRVGTVMEWVEEVMG